MARRVQTEVGGYEDRNNEQPNYNLDDLNDDAYGEEEDYGAEEAVQAPAADGAGGGDDLINYKGIYFNDDPGQKYTDPDNGAHFEFKDMCRRMVKI